MKSVALKFQSVSAFIVTPTSDDGEKLGLAVLKRFIDFQIESGVDGITLFGSTGQHPMRNYVWGARDRPVNLASLAQ